MVFFFVYPNDKFVLLAFGRQELGMLYFGNGRDHSAQPRIIHMTFTVLLNILCEKSIIILA